MESLISYLCFFKKHFTECEMFPTKCINEKCDETMPRNKVWRRELVDLTTFQNFWYDHNINLILINSNYVLKKTSNLVNRFIIWFLSLMSLKAFRWPFLRVCILNRNFCNKSKGNFTIPSSHNYDINDNIAY